MRLGLLVATILLIASCRNAKPNDLLASDLLYEKTEGGWTRTVRIDPSLNKYPDLARSIMAKQLKRFKAETNDCIGFDGNKCAEGHDFALHLSGSRLVSVIDEVQTEGGAHPVTNYVGHFFDLSEGREISFQELFKSWAQAKPELQMRFCKALHQTRPEITDCPDIEKQGISASKGQITVNTNDYAFGAYSDGSETIPIWIEGDTGQYTGFASLIKPEYWTDLAQTE